MVDECQRWRKMINYNSFNQVNCNSDDISVDRGVSAHTHIMQCKSKSHQQFPNNKGLLVYHQNICGLVNKTNEILTSLYPNFPHILCFTEHHLKQMQINHIYIYIENYNLGANFCRGSFVKGGICI
jgi:hypothetical protein